MYIDILDAQKQLCRLVESARAGEEIVITCDGMPAARLVKPGRPGTAGSIIDWLVAHPLPEHLRRSQGEIAGTITSEREAWGR